ncbi:MAG TPA: hypothetical protein PKC30_01685 [Saprospiraceae bacterium]|nr:hypothetical protein [Saprospiraceae bacterium]
MSLTDMSEPHSFHELKKKLHKKNKRMMRILIIYLFGMFIWACIYVLKLDFPTFSNEEDHNSENDELEIVNGIHVPTGLLYQPGMELVQKHCLSCHTADLIIQSRGDYSTWKETIVWMQRNHNLWDLGDDEPGILLYLSTHYSNQFQGRRAIITDQNISWYILNGEEGVD